MVLFFTTERAESKQNFKILSGFSSICMVKTFKNIIPAKNMLMVP